MQNYQPKNVIHTCNHSTWEPTEDCTYEAHLGYAVRLSQKNSKESYKKQHYYF